MFHVRRDYQIIAFFQFHQFAVGKLQRCSSTHQHNPLIVGLVVPKTRGTIVRVRNDALYLDSVALKQRQKLFFPSTGGCAGKDIVYSNAHIILNFLANSEATFVVPNVEPLNLEL